MREREGGKKMKRREVNSFFGTVQGNRIKSSNGKKKALRSQSSMVHNRYLQRL